MFFFYSVTDGGIQGAWASQGDELIVSPPGSPVQVPARRGHIVIPETDDDESGEEAQNFIAADEDEQQYPCQVASCVNMVAVSTSQYCRPCAGVTHVRDPVCANEFLDIDEVIREAVEGDGDVIHFDDTDLTTLVDFLATDDDSKLTGQEFNICLFCGFYCTAPGTFYCDDCDCFSKED